MTFFEAKENIQLLVLQNYNFLFFLYVINSLQFFRLISQQDVKTQNINLVIRYQI